MSSFWQTYDEAAARFANNVAVEIQRPGGLEQVTYRGLKEWAEAVAGWLASHGGIRRGDRCAILADNDARWCAVYLGILRLGAIAVPLDTNYSSTQVATVLKASGARLLVVGTRLLPTADGAGSGLPIFRMYAATGDDRPSLYAMFAASSPALPPCPAEPADPAVILYTSGTTSDPKGVVLTHSNLAG